MVLAMSCIYCNCRVMNIVDYGINIIDFSRTSISLVVVLLVELPVQINIIRGIDLVLRKLIGLRFCCAIYRIYFEMCSV